MLSFLNTVRLQELDNSGKILNGGKIYTYRLGTNTPKITYQDINGETPNTNPVILDSVGSAQIYLNGSYTLWLYDENDVQVGPPVDIEGGINNFITSGGSGTFADNIVVSVNNYNDVRALTNPYAWVFVQGRELQADGGEGLFYFDASSSESDDDGVTLQPSTTGRYIRYNVTNIEPTWFGLVYNDSSDQSIYLDKAATASIRYARPVLINDSVYINSNYTITSGSEYIFTDNSKMVSTLSVTMTFPSGSKILSCGRRIFGNSVQPIFGKSIFAGDTINYSIFDADNVEGRIVKLQNSSSENYFIRFDESITTSVAPQLPANFDLQYSGNVVTINSPTDLSYRTSYDGTSQLFGYTFLSAVGNVSISGDTIRPEHFGVDNNIAFKVLSQSGKGVLQAGKAYNISANLSGEELSLISEDNYTDSNLNLNDCYFDFNKLYLHNATLNMTSATIDSENIVFKDIALISDTSGAIYASDDIRLYDCYIVNENIFETSGNIFYDNVELAVSADYRFYKENTVFEDVYLRSEEKTPEYTTLLGIDDSKKIITIDNLVLPNISATNITTYNTPESRKINKTRIDFRWVYNFGPQCGIYRDDVYVSASPVGVLTATYVATSADNAVIIASTSGSTYTAYVGRIDLTTELGDVREQVTVCQDGSLPSLQVSGAVTGFGVYPGIVDQYKFGTVAYYDDRAKKWSLT